MKKNKTLQALFSFPGFKAKKGLQGQYGDHKARIIILVRQKKQQNVLSVADVTNVITIERCAKLVTWMQQLTEFMFVLKSDEYCVRSVACE